MTYIPPPKPTDDAIIAMLFIIAPQFKTTDPDVLANYRALISVIWCEVNWPVVACCGILVLVYLLAHMLTLAANPLTGVATNLSEGDLSIGLAVNANGSILDSTSYGKSYRDLIKRKVIGVTVSNLPPGFNTQAVCGGCGCGC